MNEFEFRKKSDPRWSWPILVGFTAFILWSGMSIHHMIPDAPRQWDFGALPEAPGASLYSTKPMKDGPALQQIEPLPLPPAAPTNRLETAATNAPASPP